MKKYKFRGKRLSDKQWEYGSLYQEGATACIVRDKGFAREFKQVMPNTVGMCVAKLDEQDVYEGDIIRIDIPICDVCDLPYTDTAHTFYCVVEMNEESGSIYPFDEYKYESDYFKVVGNVFDRELKMDGKVYKVIPEDNQQDPSGCDKCALKGLYKCFEPCEIYQSYNDEDYFYLKEISKKKDD